MSAPVGDDSEFFARDPEPVGKDGDGGSASRGAGSAARSDTKDLGATDAGFTSTPASEKQRGPGRPRGSRNKAKTDGFGRTDHLTSEPSATEKKKARELVETIRARHMMFGLMLGLPELALDEQKAEALAIAWVGMQREFPAMKVSPKVAAVVDMGAAATAAYMPAIAAFAMKLRVAKAKQKAGVRAGPAKPTAANASGDPPASHEGEVNGFAMADTQATATGEAIVITSGMTDSGRLNFG